MAVAIPEAVPMYGSFYKLPSIKSEQREVRGQGGGRRGGEACQDMRSHRYLRSLAWAC